MNIRSAIAAVLAAVSLSEAACHSTPEEKKIEPQQSTSSALASVTPASAARQNTAGRKTNMVCKRELTIGSDLPKKVCRDRNASSENERRLRENQLEQIRRLNDLPPPGPL